MEANLFHQQHSVTEAMHPVVTTIRYLFLRLRENFFTFDDLTDDSKRIAEEACVRDMIAIQPIELNQKILQQLVGSESSNSMSTSTNSCFSWAKITFHFSVCS